MRQETQDIVEQAVRGAPAVVGSILFGMTLEKWVAFATLLYIVLQGGYLVRKWWREESDLVKRNKRRDRRDSDREDRATGGATGDGP